MRSLTTLAFVLALSGCATQSVKKKEYRKFNKTGQLGSLTPQCSGPVKNDTCARNKNLQKGVAALTDLHEKHRTRWAKQLSDLRAIMTTPERFPVSAVVLRTGDPRGWRSLIKKYPVVAELRLEYAAGQARHKHSAKLLEAFDKMKRLEDSARDEWRSLEVRYGGPLDLGREIAQQRASTDITLFTQTEGSKKARVPADLAKKFLRGLDAVQHIDLALVYDVGGLKRRFLGNKWIPVKPAFVVIGGKTWTISETPAQRSIKQYPFKVESQRFCENLRGEIRHLERGKRPVVSWKIQKKGTVK